MKKYILAFLLLVSVSQLFAEDFNPKSFHADINQISPMAYPPEFVDGFYLELENDSVSLYLPYMGTLDVAPMGNGSDLNFEKQPISNYKTEKGKKGATTVSFNVDRGFIELRFRITAFDNNNISINLIRSDGQPCGYYGEWKAIEKKDKKKK